MNLQSRARQEGISFFGLVFVMVVLAVLGVVGAQVFPTVVEYQAILKACQKAANEGATVAQVRQVYEKAADIDNITSVGPKDIQVTKDGDNVIVSFAYNKEIHLFGPAFLLIKYAGQSKPPR